MLTVPAYKLEEWSKTYAAKAELPRWIARLIWASCKSLKRLEMPGGEHVHLAGFDGIVECIDGDDLVPSGISAWELSADANVGTKANSDFNKRNGNPGHLDKSEVTFVFATSQKWSRADAWILEKKGSGWRNVQVVWSSHLERWFERVPWLAAAFLDSIGEAPPGLESFEMIWAGYHRVAAKVGELSPHFVLGGRVAASDSFLNWLYAAQRDPSPILRVAGASRREVLHFLVATIRNRSENERVRWEARLFAVHTQEAAQGLGRLNDSHVVIVPGGDAVANVLLAQTRTGCRVVILDDTPAAAVQPNPGIQCIQIGSIPQDVWIRSLMAVGFTPEDANELCLATNCDYERLRRAAFIS
jgi:hypothetical protein